MGEHIQPLIEKPKDNTKPEQWKMWIDSLGDSASEENYLEFFAALGKDAKEEKWASYWIAYMDKFHSMDKGKPKGKQVDIYGDWVKPEEDDLAEDSDAHHHSQGGRKHYDSKTCPWMLGATNTDPLGFHIDAANENPVEAEVEEKLDRDYFGKD